MEHEKCLRDFDKQTTTRATCPRRAWSQRTTQTRWTRRGAGRRKLPTTWTQWPQKCRMYWRTSLMISGDTRGDDVRQGDGGAHQLLEAAAEDHWGTVKGGCDEHGFRARQRLEQRLEPRLAGRRGIVMAEFSGMVAWPAKSPGETIALLTEMDEVGGGRDRGGSRWDARAVSTGVDPGSCDPPTHRHEPCEVIWGPQEDRAEFANSSTTSQEAMQIGRVEAGGTAPTTAWPPVEEETSEDSWEEYGAINAVGSHQCWTCKGYGQVSWDCPNGQGTGKGKDNFGKDKGAYECKGNNDGNKGSNNGMYKGGGTVHIPSSYGLVKVYQKGDGKSGGKGPRCGKCYTCGGDHLARDCPKGGGKEGFRVLEAWETWEEPPLVEHARVLSSLPKAPPKHTGPQRVPQELK